MSYLDLVWQGVKRGDGGPKGHAGRVWAVGKVRWTSLSPIHPDDDGEGGDDGDDDDDCDEYDGDAGWVWAVGKVDQFVCNTSR